MNNLSTTIIVLYYANHPFCLLKFKILFKWANQGLFIIYFWSFQTNNTIFTTNQCEKFPNVHPVYNAGIQTHDLRYMSLLP